jgi:hypothetical protein
MMLQRPVASLGFAVTIALCGSALAQAPAAQPINGARPAALAASPATEVATPTYERRGRRDPFQPIEVVTSEMASPAVASAKLKGIVRGSTLRVLIETPDGLGYIMKLGDTLADARLVEIGADRVIFSVPSRHGSTNRIVLRLRDD